MITIGPYILEWSTYSYFDHESQGQEMRTDLHISKVDGEAMGCHGETIDKLVRVLDKFWQEEF